jgi:ABC-type phosphate transport system ATPase subunit
LLPDGLETRVEEQGANLSDGLRARVALARACAIGPRVLLVDDLVFTTDANAAAALERVLALRPLTCVQVGTQRQAERFAGRILELRRTGLVERNDSASGEERTAGVPQPA